MVTQARINACVIPQERLPMIFTQYGQLYTNIMSVYRISGYLQNKYTEVLQRLSSSQDR